MTRELSTIDQTSDELRPDYATTPGTALRAELDARGLTQADLAVRTGLSPKHINQVVQGIASLSTGTALLLERALGVDSQTWNSLEAGYQAVRTRELAEQRLDAEGEWLDHFPTQELVSRSVLDHARDAGVGHRVAQVLAFFGVADPAAWTRVYTEPVAIFRRAQHLPPDAYSIAVWLRLAELGAIRFRENHPLAPYSARRLRSVLPRLRVLTQLDDDAEAKAELQALAATAGVIVVVVRKMQGTGVNGATRWIGDHPVIALSDRYRYADVFWFSFFHEVGHILLHPRRATYIQHQPSDSSERVSDPNEMAADRFASDCLIPEAVGVTVQRLMSGSEIRRVAEEVGVGAGIIAGRIAHDRASKAGWALAAPLRRKLNFAESAFDS